MPTTTQLLQGTLTPGREITVTWDHPDDILTEPAFVMRRRGRDMAPAQTTNVERLASGVWVLKPLYERSTLYETEAAQATIVRLADTSAASTLAEVPTNRALTELSGIGAAGSVVTSGDYFLEKRIVAGSSWNNTVGGGPPTLSLPDLQYPMDRVLVSTATHASQSGYFLSLALPGSRSAAPLWFGTFYFGGAVLAGGHGQFALSIGTGVMRLSEYLSGAWSLVNEWSYAAPGDAPNLLIAVRIFPHFPTFIEFRQLALPYPDGLLGRMAFAATLAIKAEKQDSSGRSTLVHEITNRGGSGDGPAVGTLLPVTGPGQIALELRRDLLCRVQIARMQFPASGTITDRAFSLPADVGASKVAGLTLLGYNFFPDDAAAVTALTGVLQKADGSPLTTGSDSYTLGGVSYTRTGWQPPGDGVNKLRAVLTLSCNESSGARFHTPALTGYEVARNGVLESRTGASLQTGVVRSVSISGAGYQPENETASVTIDDATNSLTTLRTRGRIPVRITTTFPAQDGIPAGSSVLFEGYSGRITASLKGKAGRTYPSSEWRRLECELLGKWDRLADQFVTHRWYFDDEGTSPSGRTRRGRAPWKVTDVIRVLLHSAGIADAKLDIFDDDIRLFARTKQEAEGLLTVAPGTSIPEYLTRIARDFLNAALIWCGNAGTAGMWRLLRPPIGTETPLWNFVTTQYQAPVGAKLPNLSASYGMKRSPILDSQFRTYVVPPEFNVLECHGGVAPGGIERVTRTFVNYASFSGPTHPAALDESNLDFLPRRIGVAYVDVTVADQESLDFLGRRLFDLAGRGQKWAMFEAETVLIDAHAAEPTIYSAGKRRPLRAGDTITINDERWILHDASPEIERKAWVMTSLYLARLYRSGITWA